MPEVEAPLECLQLSRNKRNFCLYSPFKDSEDEEFKSLKEIPVPYVVVGHTEENFCYEHQACLEATWQYLDRGNRETPACNFLLGGEGNIYEDRGWNNSNALRGPAEGKGLLLCLMGHYGPLDIPTYPQVEAVQALIEYGIAKEYIKKDYKIFTTLEISEPNEVSGIYKILRKWPNFDNTFIKVTTIDVENEYISHYPLFSKSEWGGKPEKSHVEMKLPVPYVVISHTVTRLCFTLTECSPLMQNMQAHHLSMNLADLSYNFLVDSGGHLYVSRGWDKKNTLTGFVHGRSIDIAFIGDFSDTGKPTEKQLNAVKYLIFLGVQTDKISKNYALVSANATYATLSPGKNVYSKIKNWPHFDPEPQLHIKEFDEE